MTTPIETPDKDISLLREALEIALPYVEAVGKRLDRSPKILQALRDVKSIRAALSATAGKP